MLSRREQHKAGFGVEYSAIERATSQSTIKLHLPTGVEPVDILVSKSFVDRLDNISFSPPCRFVECRDGYVRYRFDPAGEASSPFVWRFQHQEIGVADAEIGCTGALVSISQVVLP